MSQFVLFNYLNDFLNLFPYRKRRKEKHNQRSLLEQKRRIVSEDDRAVASERLAALVCEDELFRQSQRVMIYHPMRHEIDVRKIMDMAPEKEYFLPVVHRNAIEVHPYKRGDKLKRGKMGVLEPITDVYTGKIDLIIVPGVGFDKSNYRIGRGGGYYDRFLKRYNHTPSIGVGYSFQLIDEVIRDKHDKRVTKVIVA